MGFFTRSGGGDDAEDADVGKGRSGGRRGRKKMLEDAGGGTRKWFAGGRAHRGNASNHAPRRALAMEMNAKY